MSFLKSSATVNGARPMPTDFSPDHLALATYVGGTKIALRFSDGFITTIDLKSPDIPLDIPIAKLKLETARASWGSAVEIRKAGGGAVHIDSAVLRASRDPEYAEELKREIASLER
jgi:hypothetical protein